MPSKPDLDIARKMWQSTKKFALTSNPNNPKVKQLLNSFDQGLGPALDKFMKAGAAGKAADSKKYGLQAIKIIKDYRAKVDALSRDAWSDQDGARGSVSQQKVVGSLEGLEDAITHLLKKFNLV